MSEDTDERLRSCHMSIQYQLLRKLSANVERFAEKKGTIEHNNDEKCYDLEQLIQYLGDDCSNISWHSSRLLYELLEKKAVSQEYLMSSCITLSALGKSLQGSVNLVLRLLLYQYDDQASIDKHPLSRILTNQGKSFNVIFSTVHNFILKCMENDLIDGSDSLVSMIKVLKPFISFVLIDCTYALNLFDDLLTASSILVHSFPDQAYMLIEVLVSCLSDRNTLQRNGSLLLPIVQRLGVWYLDHTNSFKCCHLNMEIVSILITICWNVVERNENNRVFSAFHLAHKLLVFDRDSQMMEKTEELEGAKTEAIIFVCSMMLLKVNENLVSQLLHIILLLLPPHLKSLSFHQAQPLTSILLLPILQLLSQKNSSNSKDNLPLLRMTENILRNIESILKIKRCSVKQQPRVYQSINTYSEILNVASSSVYLLDQFLNNKDIAIAWCSDVVKLYEVKPTSTLRENIILKLASLLVCNYDVDVFKAALKAMVVLCKHHCNLVNVFLPMLLYLLKSKAHEAVKLDILYTFPKIATGKNVISSILKVILSLAESNELLPICIMLMTTLWLEQPRVYPYLLQLLSKELRNVRTSSELWFEFLIARVTSILQVCRKMPTKHGEDMVVLISNIMEEAIKESQKDELFDKSASCLALLMESLKELCVTEVIDIRSIWKAVVAKVRVKNHCVILQSLCSLLSSFPSLVDEGKEAFLEEVLMYLWSLVQHADARVVGSAYQAISLFPAEMMKVKYLPDKVAVEICKGLSSSKEHKDDEEYDPKEDPIPGFGFMILLHETPADALKGFQHFLKALLQQEVSNLPRGIGSRSYVKPVSASYNQIPVILQTQYESSNRPAILPGIAGGLLCCFEPKIQGMDVEKPSNIHLKLLMGRYKLMLDTLLQEFTVRQNDWHQALLAPRSWTHFMKKVYEAFIKGRRAELYQQKEKGEFEDEEIFTEEIESVKFWARDDITNRLRKASKGTPKLQGNSMLALVGLLNAITSYEEDDESKNQVPDQYVAMRTWLLKVTDTVMTVFDGNFKAKGKPFQWCQQVSSERSTASSNFSRCCAAISLSELVQPMLSIDTNRILQMINLLKKASLGSANAGSVTQFHFYCFIGWGLLLSRLSQEQFADLAGDEGRNAMLTSLSTLEEVVYKDDTLADCVGPVIGYGLAVSSIFTHATQKDSKVHALLSYDKLLQKCTLFTADDATQINNQAFLFALACTTMSAFISANKSIEDVQTCAELIQDKIEKNPESPDLHISLGVLCYALSMSNANQASNFISKVFDSWIEILMDKEAVTSKLGCIKGITAACGIDLLAFKLRDPDKFIELPQVKNSVKVLQKLVVSTKDNAVCYTAAQHLGQLYLISGVRNQGENSNIPQNYNYLKEMSLLRSIFNSLVSAASLGPYSDWNNSIVSSLVSSLHNLTDCRLPPVNWTTVLNPILRIGYSVDVKEKCIQFAIKFIPMSSSLTRSINAWLQPSFFLKIEDNLQREFFGKAASFLTCLSNTEQKGLLEILPLSYLTNRDPKEALEATHVICVLELWISVLEMPCSVQSSSAYIMAGMTRLIECMTHMPEQLIEDAISQFAKCVYLLMKGNWTSILEMTTNHKLSSLLQIEILNYVESIQLEHILNVILLAFQNKDLTIQSHLFKTLFQLSSSPSHQSMLKEVTQKIISQDLFIKDSKGDPDIVMLILLLNTPLDWTVFPYSGVSKESIAVPMFTALRPVVVFRSPSWLSPDLLCKVQHVLLQ